MTNNDDEDFSSMTEEEMFARFHTPDDQVNPAHREIIAEMDRITEEKRARGEVTDRTWADNDSFIAYHTGKYDAPATPEADPTAPTGDNQAE